MPEAAFSETNSIVSSLKFSVAVPVVLLNTIINFFPSLSVDVVVTMSSDTLSTVSVVVVSAFSGFDATLQAFKNNATSITIVKIFFVILFYHKLNCQLKFYQHLLLK